MRLLPVVLAGLAALPAQAQTGGLAYQSFGAADADIPPAGMRVEVALDISERGRLLGCSVVPTGSERLDRAVCAMFRRTGRFNPARRGDAPVRATVRQGLWLTGRHPPPETDGPTPHLPMALPAERSLPDPSPSAWLTQADYPPDALAAGEEGDVGVRLWLDGAGTVERCELLASSGVAALDEATCRLAVGRARYAPGAASVTRTIRWRLPAGARAAGLGTAGQWITAADYPADARAARAEGTTEIAIGIDRDGRVHDCRVTRSSGSAALDEATCRLMAERARFSPATDEGGLPTRSVQTRRIRWRLPGR